MSIKLNDNIEVLAPKPSDPRYGPWVDIATALTNVPLSVRYKGLPIGIITSGSVAEYKFVAGTANGDLVTGRVSLGLSPSEIKTYYESNADTNAFTDVLKAKVVLGTVFPISNSMTVTADKLTYITPSYNGFVSVDFPNANTVPGKLFFVFCESDGAGSGRALTSAGGSFIYRGQTTSGNLVLRPYQYLNVFSDGTNYRVNDLFEQTATQPWVTNNFQPIENQRLSTTNTPFFSGLLVKGATSFLDPSGNTGVYITAPTNPGHVREIFIDQPNSQIYFTDGNLDIASFGRGGSGQAVLAGGGGLFTFGGNGSGNYNVYASELGALSGVTSNIQTQLNGKQATFVSGTTIKTINNVNLLGSGNISTALNGITNAVAGGLTATHWNIGTDGSASFADGKIHIYADGTTFINGINSFAYNGSVALGGNLILSPGDSFDVTMGLGLRLGVNAIRNITYLGDLDNELNGTSLIVNDVAQSITINAMTMGNANWEIDGDGSFFFANRKITYDNGTNQFTGVGWTLYDGGAAYFSAGISALSFNTLNGLATQFLKADGTLDSSTYLTSTTGRASLSFTAGSGAYNNLTGVITIPTNNNQITNGSNYISLASLSSSATGLTYTNTSGVFSLTSGYIIPTTISYNNTNWDTTYNKRITSLTSTGNNGSATLISNTLNIPTYSLLGLGGVALSGSVMTGLLTLSGDPTNSLGAATKNYVDSLITGITWKNAVKAATVTNITLSGTQTIDGIVLSVNDKVLVKNQTNATQNGLYIVNSSTWVRTIDADSSLEVWGAAVYVQSGGTINGSTQWANSNVSQPVIGTDNITFAQIAGVGVYTNGAYLSLTGNIFDINSTYSSQWNTAYTNRITSLTTTGNSGAATLLSNVLNIPTHTLAGLGGQPLATNLTSLSALTYSSSSFVKMSASGSFSLDTTIYTKPIRTAFTAQTIINVTHSFGVYPMVQVIDSTGSVLIPQSIVNNTVNDFTVTFSSSRTGTIITIG